MRTDCSWSMSTAGLTAQEICLPAQSLFPRGSHWYSMAGAKPSWKYHDLHNLYFTLDTSMDYNLQSQQQVLSSYSVGDKQRTHHLQSPNSPGGQPLPPKKSKPSQLTLLPDPFTSSLVEDDQVVPCFQRLTVSDRISPPQTPSRATKPLPPIPGSAELSLDQAMDNEVEFFNGEDNHCLVSEPCSKHSSFRYGMPSRRSLRGCGLINYAYYEGPTQQKEQPHPQPQPQKPRQERETQQREQELRNHHHEQQQQQNCLQQQERTQRKLRRSHSGPAGCFNKPTSFRLSSHNRNFQGLDKPEVPPRVPIPPRPIKTGDYRRWSAEVSSGANSDEDRPPKVPPREPLSDGSSRTPSPKSLPMYINGIMPPTQSFAPDPKYVSRGLQRQNSEGSPCILPVMEDGQKASTTHYFLLPQRPAYLDKHEKYLMDSTASRGTDASDSNSDWDCESKRKTTHQLDLV
ncbi:ERBB receptor feedback inhibitor 1a [Myxocyprinus asiaticus]|uniref:ERBB receptor feedback inhibitor 1a n=1 Tax=Myxocyprinus asiaticus TaxID=70543 RepID=UPI002222E907|nr:ERBB receptor feedback inhibitor 1a [Myxocyprinus asiaticus]